MESRSQFSMKTLPVYFLSLIFFSSLLNYYNLFNSFFCYTLLFNLNTFNSYSLNINKSIQLSQLNILRSIKFPYFPINLILPKTFLIFASLLSRENLLVRYSVLSRLKKKKIYLDLLPLILF